MATTYATSIQNIKFGSRADVIRHLAGIREQVLDEYRRSMADSENTVSVFQFSTLTSVEDTRQCSTILVERHDIRVALNTECHVDEQHDTKASANTESASKIGMTVPHRIRKFLLNAMTLNDRPPCIVPHTSSLLSHTGCDDTKRQRVEFTCVRGSIRMSSTSSSPRDLRHEMDYSVDLNHNMPSMELSYLQLLDNSILNFREPPDHPRAGLLPELYSQHPDRIRLLDFPRGFELRVSSHVIPVTALPFTFGTM